MPSHRFMQVGAGHPSVRRYLTLRQRPGRAGDGAVAIEGLWALERALAASAPVTGVFVCDEMLRGPESATAIARAEQRGAEVFAVSPRTLARMVSRDGPDGLAAIARRRVATLAALRVDASSRVLVMDSAEMAGNIGAVIRCADGAGASAVVLTDSTTTPSHPLAVKASMGTIFSMPVVEADAAVTVHWVRAHGLHVVAADPFATRSYRDARYRGPVAMVVGSERYGLSDAWRAAADDLVVIPMLGAADSLNVGHAAALLLYEALHGQTPPSRVRS